MQLRKECHLEWSLDGMYQSGDLYVEISLKILLQFPAGHMELLQGGAIYAGCANVFSIYAGCADVEIHHTAFQSNTATAVSDF
jgi:hypothetical protein